MVKAFQNVTVRKWQEYLARESEECRNADALRRIPCCPCCRLGTLLEAAVMLLVFFGALFPGLCAPAWTSYLQGSQLEGKSHNYKLNGLTLFLITAIVAGLCPGLRLVFPVRAVHPLCRIVRRGKRICFRAISAGCGCVIRPPGNGIHHSWSSYGASFSAWSYNPDIARGGFEAFQLPSFAHRPGTAQCIVCSVVQYDTYGGLTLAMGLYQVFTFLYVLNYFQFEHGMILHLGHGQRALRMDVGLGRLCPGALFLLPGRLVAGPRVGTAACHHAATVLIILLFAFGFWLFRGANEQKHRFKRDPGASRSGDDPAQSLDGRLLVSGFWGIGRHLNYTGEICIYLAFVLTTGLRILGAIPAAGVACRSAVWHRSIRDERRCQFQVRRAVGTLQAAGALLDAAICLLGEAMWNSGLMA